MAEALDALIGQVSPLDVTADLWDDAFVQAGQVRSGRSGAKTSPKDRILELKATIEQELVGFHEQLVIRPHAGDQTPTKPDNKLWDVEIPLTLFPKRHSGFNRIECVFRLFMADGNNAEFRVLKLHPAERETLLARGTFSGKLNMSAKGTLDAMNVHPAGGASAGVEIDAGLETGDLSVEASRRCVETEIMMGTGARWRLEDANDTIQLQIESHSLKLVLETSDGSDPIDAAGYIQAFSTTRWVTRLIDGNFWLDFRGQIKTFFERGMPIEAYAEWKNILGNETS
ncbi:MAG: hypothetical protein R8G34_02825 [Paracoccaceae bacterium]|nr:hypothetical protein [Paracoccaceae bacterium]